MNENNTYGPNIFKRNEYGLLENISYVFKDDGSIDWRLMIKPEFLYANREWFEARGQQAPTSIDGLNDKQLLIMLGGIKDLAKLRGFTDISYEISHIKDNYVVAKCQMAWIANYETNNKTILFEDVANATIENTDSFCIKFLETIACNRAFVRCVRNFLNIHIVGADEIDRSKNAILTLESPVSDHTEDLSILKPSGLLEKTAIDNGISSFEDFVSWLRERWQSNTYRNDQAKNWKSFKDIPPKECRKIIALFKKV